LRAYGVGGRAPVMKDRLSKLVTYPEELGLDVTKEHDRFKWFLASVLFAKRISSGIAKRTYREFEAAGIVTPQDIMDAGWDRLVEVLDSGGYVRYDFSTASNLLETAAALKSRYGSLEAVHAQARDSADLEKRLLEFKGMGPTAVNIFLRELRGVWDKANPRPSPPAREAARRLGLAEADLTLPRVEPALVRLHLEFCKGRKCSVCPVRDACREAGSP